jgi:hypothetical protein
MSDDAHESYGPYHKGHPPPLDFERWAAVAASLSGCDGEERLERLADAEIEPALFDACDVFWGTTIATQIAKGELGLAKRFAAICTAALERRSAQDEREPEGEGTSHGAATFSDETEFLTAIADDAPLPFKPHVAASSPQTASEASATGASFTGATAFIVVDSVQMAPLPFEAPMHPERYAELVARTEAMAPEVVATLHAELGLGETQRGRIDREMKRFFADHPAARAAYEQHLERVTKKQQ